MLFYFEGLTRGRRPAAEFALPIRTSRDICPRPSRPLGGGGQTQAALTDVRTTPRPYVCGPSETQSLHVQAISRRPPLPGHNSHPLSCETANHINTRLRPAAVTFVTIYRYTSTYYRQRALAHECPPTKRTHSEREAPAPCTFVAESK